ncbi:MAG: AAA family ATPase [Muribaculaceae bacterium]|nr:AAA family ATPase [Muribaculaceae bacterium]
MKIKYLKIRNIASIECGDIDFENGLIDNESGLPASLFLITGDTGSGKSVILDCISMALYGTTPRVKGVSDVKNNNYKNNDGEEISVNNIRQYTRIGISWKDDCYAELSFSGNDGIDYVSRYSLGRTSHRKYRDPAWRLTIDGSTTIEKKEEIKERIQKAVGLSFEQFSRMAMLAQGQFATFLIGKKEERERILEQLTATDIFSRYGEAISNIYKKAKQEKEISAKLYEEFGKKIISDEIRKELLSEQEEKKKLASTLHAESDKLRNRILHIDVAMKAEKDISVLKEEEAFLKKHEESSEFRKGSALTTLWDKTERERNLLSKKLETTQSVESDKRTLHEMKSEFMLLSKDLEARKEAANERTLILEEERKWIKMQEPLLMVFEESSVTIHKIDNYVSLLKETGQKEKTILDNNALIEILLKDLGQLEKSVKDKEEACNACQISIKQKSDRRDALNPGNLRKEGENLLKRKHSLLDLSSRLANAKTEKEEVDKEEKDLSATSKLLAKLKVTADKAAKECKKAEKEMKDAEDRYMTMHLSVKKNFRELRRKLSDDHACNCPLCGQSISEFLGEWNKDGYFSGLLSPLEEEKKKLTDTYYIAKEASDDAHQKMNTTAGSLKTKESELLKRKENLTKTDTEIKQQLKVLEISECDNLPEVIENQLSDIESEIYQNSVKLASADEMQKEIDELLKQKDVLDKQYRDADSLLQKSLQDLAKKKETVRNDEVRIEELRAEIVNLRNTITQSLRGYADEWQSDPSAIAIRLKKNADEFAERTSKFTKDEHQHDILLKVLDSLTAIQEKLSEHLVSVDEEAEGVLSYSFKSFTIETLQNKWNDFLIEVSTVINRYSENNFKIKEIERELNEHYIASGTTETMLRQLLGASKEVKEARIIQIKHREDLSKNAALIADAEKCLKENLRALDAEDTSQIKDRDQVKDILTDNEKKISELTQQLGVIKERLEADEKTRRDSERQREDLERKTLRYEKWDKMNRYFGGTKFRTLVQSHILRPLLDNANIYLRQITDHYTLTCGDDNEQLSILVLDRYHNNEPRSVTVLSGGERFMISLALSLALSAMNRPDLNVDILFIDEGFGTLDAKSLDMVMSTLRRLPEINGQNGRRVGVISHREELTEQIPTQIQLRRSGHGRSKIVIRN